MTISILLMICWTSNLSAQIQHFTWQGVEREYLVRTPTQHDGPLPVLFFLHGLYGQIVPYDQDFNFSQMAEEFGWAIIVPQALDLGMGTMWNVGMTDSDVDDSGFLMALLDSLMLQYHLDPDSIFFTGFSMGGFMTYRMAIEHGDRITACAPVSGLISNALSSVTPVAPVRMLHIHGTDDYIVGYNGYSSFFTKIRSVLGWMVLSLFGRIPTDAVRNRSLTHCPTSRMMVCDSSAIPTTVAPTYNC